VWRARVRKGPFRICSPAASNLLLGPVPGRIILGHGGGHRECLEGKQFEVLCFHQMSIWLRTHVLALQAVRTRKWKKPIAEDGSVALRTHRKISELTDDKTSGRLETSRRAQFLVLDQLHDLNQHHVSCRLMNDLQSSGHSGTDSASRIV
jgi:hypothetical protein